MFGAWRWLGKRAALNGAWGRKRGLFPWIRDRGSTGDGTGLGPIVEIWVRGKLVVVMWMNSGRLDGVMNKQRKQALSGAACSAVGGGWGSVPLLTEPAKCRMQSAECRARKRIDDWQRIG